MTERKRVWVLFILSGRWNVLGLNPITTKGGYIAQPPPPPPHACTSSNISRTLGAKDLKLSDNLNELVIKPKIFQPPPPTIGYHSNVQSCRIFLKTYFGSLHASAPRTRRLLKFQWSVPNVASCGNFGLVFRLMGSQWQFSFHTLILWFNDFKMANTISMAPGMMSFDFIFH